MSAYRCVCVFVQLVSIRLHLYSIIKYIPLLFQFQIAWLCSEIGCRALALLESIGYSINRDYLLTHQSYYSCWITAIVLCEERHFFSVLF